MRIHIITHHLLKYLLTKTILMKNSRIFMNFVENTHEKLKDFSPKNETKKYYKSTKKY